LPIPLPKIPPPTFPPDTPPIPAGGSGRNCSLFSGYKPSGGKKCWYCNYFCTGGPFGGVPIGRYQIGGCIRSTTFAPGWEHEEECEKTAKKGDCLKDKMPYEGIYPEETQP